ncbi:hypothetical protein IC582_021338 [Cucumis melo]
MEFYLWTISYVYTIHWIKKFCITESHFGYNKILIMALSSKNGRFGHNHHYQSLQQLGKVFFKPKEAMICFNVLLEDWCLVEFPFKNMKHCE